MRENAVVFIIGMFAAAIVGIAALFGMQSLLPGRSNESKSPDTRDSVASAVGDQLNSFEYRVDEKISEIAASVDALNAQLSRLERKLDSSAQSAVIVARDGKPQVAQTLTQTDEGQPINEGRLEKVVQKVLDETDKRRAEERAQRMADMQDRMQQRLRDTMGTRVEQFGKEKSWNSAKTDRVKQILNEQIEKMGTLGSGGRDGGPPSSETLEKMRQTTEEARTQMLEILTQDEIDELFKGMPWQLGWLFRSTGSGGNAPGQPTPPAPMPGE